MCQHFQSLNRLFPPLKRSCCSESGGLVASPTALGSSLFHVRPGSPGFVGHAQADACPFLQPPESVASGCMNNSVVAHGCQQLLWYMLSRQPRPPSLLSCWISGEGADGSCRREVMAATSGETPKREGFALTPGFFPSSASFLHTQPTHTIQVPQNANPGSLFSATPTNHAAAGPFLS